MVLQLLLLVLLLLLLATSCFGLFAVLRVLQATIASHPGGAERMFVVRKDGETLLGAVPNIYYIITIQLATQPANKESAWN